MKKYSIWSGLVLTAIFLAAPGLARAQEDAPEPLLEPLSSSTAQEAAAPAVEFAPHYPNYKLMVQEIYKLADQHPDLVDVEEFGKSVENRPLLAIHIYRKDGVTRPSAMVAGNIHGNEMIGNRMAMAVAKRLADGADTDPWVKGLLDKMDFWVLPCLNPDGYFHTVELFQKGDLKGHRKNAHDVDLNRNFLLPEPRRLNINWAGSPKKENANYHGPFPMSEPEDVAVKEFLDKHPVFGSINYHSVQGVFFPARCKGRVCARQHQQMGKAYRSHQKNVKYLYVRWPGWADTFTGEMEDMQYHFYGTLALDIELGKAKKNQDAAKKELGEKKVGPSKLTVYNSGFWTFNPINLDYWVTNDCDGTIYALEEAFKITGGKPIPREKRK